VDVSLDVSATWVVHLAARRSARSATARGYEGPLEARVTLDRPHAIEITFLAIATIYSLTLPLKRTLALFDAAVLITLFVLYAIRISRAPAEEPHLVGPARLIGDLPPARRRTVVVVMLLAAAGVILASAEPFAQSHVDPCDRSAFGSFLPL